MSQFISVFDMLKIGIGPSSSHTLGPWRAAQYFVAKADALGLFESIDQIKVDLYGSLSLTGKGHATDLAILLGLSGEDPELIDVNRINKIVGIIQDSELLILNKKRQVVLKNRDVKFHRKFLPL